MRLGLSQNLRTEQRLVQSPQMIQAMQILQTPLVELKDQIERELQENVFLELRDDVERNGQAEAQPEPQPHEDRLEREFAQEIEQLETRSDPSLRMRGNGLHMVEGDNKQQALNNTPDNDASLAEHLMSQVRLMRNSPELTKVAEHVVFSLDADGKLADTAEQISLALLVPLPLAQEAIALVRNLDPVGMAARDLRDRLLMQLDHLSYVRPLTRKLVENHLDDLARNKLPKIAKETGQSIEEIKESLEFLRHRCDPHPASQFAQDNNAGVVPDVVVEEVDGRFEVRSERGSVPELSISPAYRDLLKEARNDPKIYDYLRRKIESAKWFMEAVHQRQNTIERIATEIIRRQEDFLRHGVQKLKPMRMQDVADAVGVHISTVSRAASGKYIQTPQGIFDMKKFFSGGTQADSGELVSQQAVKDTLKQVVDAEDKSSPYSDDQLVEALGKKGVHIARRTVTKYRKALGIDASTRRRVF
ncbi:MAG: RNA polymerase factor sigma-54 [Planctomycetota bacterium]|nr:RNA polymerase factor sigma-54 [Planctomycetota bacterium]